MESKCRREGAHPKRKIMSKDTVTPLFDARPPRLSDAVTFPCSLRGVHAFLSGRQVDHHGEWDKGNHSAACGVPFVP
jgi:hypothetical protein